MMPTASGSPLAMASAIFFACSYLMCGGSGGTSWSTTTSSTTGRSAASACVPRRAHLVAASSHRMPRRPRSSAYSRVGHVGDRLRALELRVAGHGPLLPGDLVEVLVVEHAEDQRRVRASRSQYRLTVSSSFMPFIWNAPSPTIAITGRSGIGELGADRVRHARAHRGERARQRGPHAPRAASGGGPTSSSTEPESAGEDRAVGQRGSRAPRTTRCGFIGSASHRARASSITLPPLRDLALDLLPPGAVLLALEQRDAAPAASSFASPTRWTSIG